MSSLPRPRALFLVAAIVAPAASLAGAAPALAGSITASIGTRGGASVLVLAGSPDPDGITLDRSDAQAGLVITPADGTALQLAAGDAAIASRCTAGVGGALRCNIQGLGQYTTTSIAVGEVNAELGSGDDALKVTRRTDMHGLFVDAGDGDDQIVGSDEPDHFEGGPGNDYLAGYGGSDWLVGADGNDFVHLSPDDADRYSSPDDRDDDRSSCGPGTDMVYRDQTREDIDVLADQASCETDIGKATWNGVKATTPNVSYYPGDTLAPDWTFTRSQPTAVDNEWQTCTESGVGYITYACTTVATGPSFTIPASLLGQKLRVRSVSSYSVPGNPVVWFPALGTYSSSPDRVADVKFGSPAVPTPPSSTDTRPITTQLAALRTQLLGSAKKPSVSLRGKGPKLSGNAGALKVHVVATISVAPTALGKSKKGKPILVARIDTTSTGAFSVNVKPNASGKKLIARLGKKRTVRATLKVWTQVGSGGPASSTTRVIKLSAR